MAYFDGTNGYAGGSGASETTTAALTDLGLACATGREGKVDLVTAHQWFNIAAMRGDKEAVRLRREIAAEMSDAEIGAAQRAARAWLKAHPLPTQETPQLRAAA